MVRQRNDGNDDDENDDDDDDDDVLTVHQVVQMVECEWQTKMYLCTANAEKNKYLLN